MPEPDIVIESLKLRRNLRKGFGDALVTCRVTIATPGEPVASVALDFEAWLPSKPKGFADDPEGWVLRTLRDRLCKGG